MENDFAFCLGHKVELLDSSKEVVEAPNLIKDNSSTTHVEHGQMVNLDSGATPDTSTKQIKKDVQSFFVCNEIEPSGSMIFANANDIATW